MREKTPSAKTFKIFRVISEKTIRVPIAVYNYLVDKATYGESIGAVLAKELGLEEKNDPKYKLKKDDEC